MLSKPGHPREIFNDTVSGSFSAVAETAFGALYGLEINWSEASTLSGTFGVSVSNKGLGWSTLPLEGGNPAIADASDAPDAHHVTLANFAYQYLKVDFVHTAGSGNLSINILEKKG